ncbi:DUF2510 domain-containing protein [Demequina gelatinilytica]|uniref:DUF2510 domain-containing protein n=1 Tax=Demequina gelatinilytica TaxID=1638980 RepID=UPI0007866B56|nr:DUF2510 domain-containing protein [Demequina gelatinilytica]
MEFTPEFGQEPAPPRAVRLPEAGWLPDPSETDLERYWSGTAWTGRVRDRVTKVERGMIRPQVVLELYARERRRRRGRVAWRVTFAALAGVLAVSLASTAGLLPESANVAAIAADAVNEATRPGTGDSRYPIGGSTELVRHLATAMVEQDDSIDVSYWVRSEGSDAVDDAMREALTQNPYVFVRGWTVRTRGGGTTIAPNYVYDDAEAERRRLETQTAVAVGLEASGANAATSDADKVAAIHDHLASVATYDMAAFEAMHVTDTSPVIERSQEAYGILVDGTAVCNGYAQAFLAMAWAAGLEAVEVTGSDSAGATGGDHAWNKVLVDGRWLLVDVTWDDSGDPPRPYRDYLMVKDSARVLATRTTDASWIVDEHLGDYAS